MANPKITKAGEPPPSLSSRWETAFGAGCVVLAAFAAYHNALSGPFVLDDMRVVVDNPTIRHLWPLGPVLSPPADLPGRANITTGQVVNLSYAINYAFGGLAVRGYHLFNLITHMAAGLAVFGIVRRTLHPGTLVAAAVAVLWAVHPLTTEAVAYVTERNELLMGLCYLLTIYCFVRYASAKAGRWRWGVLSVGACLMGMASKQVAVTAPLMVFLYDRTFVSGTFREAWRQHFRLHLGLMSTWLFMVYQLQSLGTHAVGFSTGVSWWAYALTESRAVTHYLLLAFWPHPQVVDFGITVLVTGILQVGPSILLLAVLLALTAMALRHRPVLGFVGSWFFVILAPTSTIVPIAGQPVAEHRMYLPLVAVIALVAFTLHTWLGRRSLGIFLALAVVLGWRTVQRNEVYGSATAFYGDIVQKRPGNYYARYNLANALVESGAVPEAIVQFQEAIRLEPSEVRLHLGLGDAYSNTGRLQEAAEQYAAALHLAPNSAEAHCSLGNLLFKVGRVSEAVNEYKAALQAEPGYAEVYYNLGVAQARLRSFADAIGSYEQALRLGADTAEVHGNLGIALAEIGRLSEAAAQFREALRQNPNYAEARRNYGIVLRMQGRVNEVRELETGAARR